MLLGSSLTVGLVKDRNRNVGIISNALTSTLIDPF